MLNIINELLWMLAFSADSVFNFVFSTIYSVIDKMVLDMPGYIGSYGYNFSQLNMVIYVFAMQFILLKFVRKAVDIYGLQTDGDANSDIVVLITNFCKAIVIAMTFTIIWSWIYDIASDFLKQLYGSVALHHFGHIELIEGLKDAKEKGETIAICSIYALDILLNEIMSLIQIFNGVQLWILRVGMPLACVGLMDADQGVFRTYMKLFLKVILTIIVQFTLMNLGLLLLYLALQTDVKMILSIISIGVIVMAFTTPKILNDLLMPKQGGGGAVMQVVYLGSMMVRSL